MPSNSPPPPSKVYLVCHSKTPCCSRLWNDRRPRKSPYCNLRSPFRSLLFFCMQILCCDRNRLCCPEVGSLGRNIRLPHWKIPYDQVRCPCCSTWMHSEGLPLSQMSSQRWQVCIGPVYHRQNRGWIELWSVVGKFPTLECKVKWPSCNRLFCELHNPLRDSFLPITSKAGLSEWYQQVPPLSYSLTCF